MWCSGWRLASAVSNAGGLGLLGAGSMHPETLREHIRKCRAATDRPFGVNIPLMYPQIEEIMDDCCRRGRQDRISLLPEIRKHGPDGCTNVVLSVAHVVSSSRFAMKCEEAGVDAVVAEGFEAGGHNGREETTTFCLIPAVRECDHFAFDRCRRYRYGRSVSLPPMALGAEGVQMGTRFALTDESSASAGLQRILSAVWDEGDTKLLLKKLAPTRFGDGIHFRDAVVEAAEGWRCFCRRTCVTLLG